MKLSQSWKPYIIEKSSQVSLEAALALSVMPHHDSERPANVYHTHAPEWALYRDQQMFSGALCPEAYPGAALESHN